MQTCQDAIARMKDYLARDAARYDRAVSMQRAAFYREPVREHPLLLSSALPAEFADYPRFTYKEIHYDHEKMLYNGLLDAIAEQAGGRESVPSVRANMGCGIVPGLFGLVQDLFDDKMPWLQHHLPADQIREMTTADLTITPEFQAALDHMEYMAEELKGTGVRVYPLDIQGAFDTAHLVMGDDIFYQMFDEPELVHHLLSLSCDAIDIAFRECLKRIPGSEDTVAHYSYLAMPRALGGLKLSEDTSTLLSPSAIEEFVKPYLHRAMESAGGGYVHYCGRNDALLETVLSEPLVHGLNFGNPDKHDMAQVLAQVAESGKLFIGAMPRLKDETLPEFMARVANASSRNGVCHLLLTQHAPAGEAEAYRAAWDEAAARACGQA
ncbi:MAG: hypothetical protein IJ048_02755 [Clostridia bacterium]|nr:hypothetical protein [Clostridia bacterium]